MKKVISALSIATLAISLAACGGTSTKATPDKASEEKPFDINSLEGDYIEQNGGQATLNIVKDEDGLFMVVDWSQDEESMGEWIMTPSYEDGKLTYSDCTYSLYNNMNMEDMEEEDLGDVEDQDPEVYTDGSGYFEVDEKTGNLLWTGADIEECKNFVFVKDSSAGHSGNGQLFPFTDEDVLTDEDVIEFANEVKNDVTSGNWEDFAEKVAYPITVDNTTYNNKEEFLKENWDKTLSKKFIEAIAAETCEDLFADETGVMLGEDGQIWVGPIADENGKFPEMKIIKINK